MSLADVRIILFLLSIAAVTALVSSVFGLKGVYFMLVFHTGMNGILLTASLMANGKL